MTTPDTPLDLSVFEGHTGINHDLFQHMTQHGLLLTESESEEIKRVLKLPTLLSHYKALSERVAELEKDRDRLDFLDETNAPKLMGWRCGIAPAGNVSVESVIQVGGKLTSIREAIDQAIAAQGGDAG